MVDPKPDFSGEREADGLALSDRHGRGAPRGGRVVETGKAEDGSNGGEASDPGASQATEHDGSGWIKET